MSPPTLYDDVELYDLQHAGYRDDLAFYRRLVLDQGGPVLELGAGTGRLTVPLGRLGVELVAVEPHDAMRARCAARVAEADLGASVRVLDADARSLPSGLEAALVIAPFNMLMHLDTIADQDAALAGARERLAAGGAFACDLFVPRFGRLGVVRAERLPGPPGRERDLVYWQEHDDVAQVVTTHLRLDEQDEGGRLRRRAAVLRQRYWTRFELERALATAGFANVRLYGDFERGPLTERSSVMAAIARG